MNPRFSQAPQFAAAVSTERDWRDAVTELVPAASQLEGSPDLAFVFLSPHHAEDAEPLLAELRRELGARVLLGATGESIVAGPREVEHEPALAVWLARLPGAELFDMHLEFERTAEGGSFIGWPSQLPEPWPERATLLLFGEPYSFPADILLARMNEDRPDLTILGGLASGGGGPGENRLLHNDRVLETGAVGVLLAGNVRIRSVVSQGCRPIGRHFVITRAERNVIQELSGQQALAQLREVLTDLDPAEQRQALEGLHLGRVINEYQERFERGDFLVRNVIGADPEAGAVAVTDYVRPGQTVQFHIRDAAAADEDLRELLSAAAEPSPAAALLFTCNGRGTRLFNRPHHDAALVQQVLGDIPLAGFFAQGEIGPVSGQNFLHGFTASLAVFDRPDEDDADVSE